MPYCVKCGQTVEEKDTFCGICGKKLPSFDEKGVNINKLKNIKNSRFFKPVLYGGSAVIVVVLLILLIWPALAGLRSKQAYIESLDATVVDLKLFEAGDFPPSVGFRNYDTRFSKSTSRYIYWELSLKHPRENNSKSFRVTVVYYYPNGSKMGEVQEWFMIDAGLSESTHSWGYGWSEPGHWSIGEHSVEIVVDEQVVARRSFEIY